jgi:hypothetical protein
MEGILQHSAWTLNVSRKENIAATFSLEEREQFMEAH